MADRHACRYARVDRRPLDPPPVVQLRLYDIHNEGTDHESEQEVQDYEYVEPRSSFCSFIYHFLTARYKILDCSAMSTCFQCLLRPIAHRSQFPSPTSLTNLRQQCNPFAPPLALVATHHLQSYLPINSLPQAVRAGFPCQMSSSPTFFPMSILTHSTFPTI